MLSVREVPLSPEALRILENLIAAAPQPAAGFFSRLMSGSLFDREYLAARAALARTALSRGVCDEVEVRNDRPPAVLTHEHGIFLFVPVDAAKTLLLDVSSVSEDVRWGLHSVGRLVCKRWRWLRFRGFEGPWCFTTEGPPVTARDLGDFHGTALEQRLTEDMDWPGDDAVLPLSLGEIERLARQPGDVAAA